MKELIIPIHPKAVIRPMQRNSCEKSPTQMLVSKEINVQREQMFSCLNNKFIFILYTLVFGPHVCVCLRVSDPLKQELQTVVSCCGC